MDTINVVIAFVAVLVTIIIGFVSFAVQFGGIRKTVERLVDDVRDLSNRLGGVENRLGRIEGEVSGLNVRLGLVESNVSLLMTQKISFSNSPRRLSDTGERLLDTINGRSLVDGDYANLKNLSLVNGDSRLDIQEGAKKAVEILYTSGKLNEFEDEIFRTGKTLNDVFDALGLYLRDKIFREKGLGIDE